MNDMQSGRTTNQMLHAPKGAVFIWPTASLSYPRQLARAIGRDDLLIKPISWLDPSRLHGIRAVAIVDHSCHSLTRENLDALDFLRMRMLSISEGVGE